MNRLISLFFLICVSTINGMERQEQPVQRKPPSHRSDIQQIKPLSAINSPRGAREYREYWVPNEWGWFNGEITPLDQNLIRSAERNDIESVVRCIRLNGYCNARYKNWQTALHRAVINGHLAVARMLIACGAYVNLIDGYGRTPLHYAAAQNHHALVSLLLTSFADITIRDNEGNTAYELTSHAEIKVLFENRGDLGFVGDPFDAKVNHQRDALTLWAKEIQHNALKMVMYYLFKDMSGPFKNS